MIIVKMNKNSLIYWGQILVINSSNNVITVLLRYLTVNYGTWKKLHIPGPPPAVALGNTVKMFDPVKGVRQVLDEWKQKYGKVFGLYFFEKPLLVVMDIELLKIVYVKTMFYPYLHYAYA